jgi:hypothetical protein
VAERAALLRGLRQALQGHPHAEPLLDGIVDAWVEPLPRSWRPGARATEARAQARLGVAVVRGCCSTCSPPRDREAVDAAMERYIARSRRPDARLIRRSFRDRPIWQARATMRRSERGLAGDAGLAILAAAAERALRGLDVASASVSVWERESAGCGRSSTSGCSARRAAAPADEVYPVDTFPSLVRLLEQRTPYWLRPRRPDRRLLGEPRRVARQGHPGRRADRLAQRGLGMRSGSRRCPAGAR